MALVSVIIPTHNRSALLKQAIESVLATERDGNELEIIVVDDGSTDDTPEVVKDYPVVYLRQSGGLGPAGSRNVGVAAAHGDYISFVDDDDIWLPAKLTAHLRLFCEHPEYDLVHAQMLHCDSNLEVRSAPYPPDARQTQWSLTDILRIEPQVGAVMVRRSVAQKIQFDSAMRWMEDWDWVLKVAQCYRVGYTNVPVMLFRGRPRNAVERWMFYRGSVKVFHRNTRALPFLARLKVQPILWTLRGEYVWEFFQDARQAVHNRNYLRAASSIGYALRISPLHLAVVLKRFVWVRIARLHAASAP